MRLAEFANPVGELKDGLLQLSNFDYDTIDRLMTGIAKKHGISPKKLHDLWVSKYKQIPDTWIKAKK
jgi:ABC-type proline/glycine betaine transport system substrate-binding protein